MEFVRVKDPATRHEFTTTRDFAEATGLKVLQNKTAVNAYGHPLPAKNYVDLSGLTVPELTEHAESEGVDLAGATKKPDIVAAIEAAEGKE